MVEGYDRYRRNHGLSLNGVATRDWGERYGRRGLATQPRPVPIRAGVPRQRHRRRPAADADRGRSARTRDRFARPPQAPFGRHYRLGRTGRTAAFTRTRYFDINLGSVASGAPAADREHAKPWEAPGRSTAVK